MTNKMKKSLFTLFTAICVSALVVFVCLALSVYLPQKREQNKFKELKQIVSSCETSKSSFSSLYELNSDYAGWLKIEDTKIDYPVMKAPVTDPEYYLRRNFYKKNSLAGSLFLGENCDFNSICFIIYGHNMLTDTMFGTLEEYRNFDFAKEHPNIKLTTSQGTKIFRVFSAFQTQLDENRFKYYEAVGDLSKLKYYQTLEQLRAESDITVNEAPEYPAQIMLLSTCSYHTKDGRFVVAAYEVR